MKLEKLIGERFKERPSDCVIDSHAIMIRGGYIKYVGSGIYSMYTPLKRITRRIEQIIREEMDSIDGQEVLFPVVIPASLWQESGRYDSVGSELLRFVDRNGSQMVLGMTHEEASVHLARGYGSTYSNYPFMFYQIQTKFRDEARPRGGLIRVREFTMKDAYSFHTSQADLDIYYSRCLAAYERIFARAGIPETISVASDSGMMGGSLSHEFMLLTPVGEDSLAICSECDYRANMEAAQSIVPNTPPDIKQELAMQHTPGMESIEDVCSFLESAPEQSCKAVVYQTNSDNRYVIAFLRGDMDVNETKLRNLIGEEIHPAVIDQESDICVGFIGPKDLKANCVVLFDTSLKDTGNLICGANVKDYHFTGFSIERDLGEVVYNDISKIKDGGICPKCGSPSITISRGIEVGNIFQLGDKYTRSMEMQYSDSNDELHYPLMGCYGIGVGRLAASVCEAHHDDYGPIWPISIAPWQVHLCCMRADDQNTKICADTLYKELLDLGLEVIYDDRTVSAGIMFADADLLGVPIRIVVSPRNMKENCCEVSLRDKSMQKKIPLEGAPEEIKSLVIQLLKG